MKFRKLSTLFVALALLLTAFASSASAAAPKPTTVLLNGAALQDQDWQPIIENGTTLVPLRPLLTKLHIPLGWDNETKTASGAKDGYSFSLRIGSTDAQVNGAAAKLTVAPRVVRGATYVPLRFVAEATGYKVGWDQTTNTITLDSQEAAKSVGFLWKATKNDNTVYLLGSIHIANEAMYPLRPEIEAAFKSADTLTVEVDMTKIDAAAMQKLTQETGMYTDGTTLKDHVSAETYAKVGEILKARGLAENALDTYKVWLVAQTIPALQITDKGYQQDLGIDMYFMQQAQQANKPIEQMETAEQQLNMLAGFSDKLQEEQLNEVIEAYNSPNQDIGASMDELANMWKTGDESELLDLVKQTAVNAEYYKALVADRNAGMIDKTEAYLNGDGKKTTFIVVGALHMLGDDGIVTKLKADGYTVEKL